MKGRTKAVLSAGWLIVLGTGGRVLLWPAYARARDLDADIASKQATIARSTTGPEVIEKLAGQLVSLRALGDARMTPIAEEAGVAALVSGLSDSLDKLGLTDRELTTGAQHQLEEASVLPMSMIIRGDFPSIARALAQTEELPRLVRVQRLRLSLDNKNTLPNAPFDRSGRIKAEIALDVFFAPKTVAAVPASTPEVAR